MADTATNILITARDEASVVFGKIEGGLGSVTGKLAGFAAAVGGAAAIVAGGRWLTDITSKAIDAAGRIDDLAQATGVSGETLTRFGLAAKLGGTDVEGLAGGLQKLNLKIDDAATGGKEATAAFDRIGVSVKDAGGEVRATEDVLGDIAEKFAGMEDGAAKTSLAVDLFGKSGTNLIPMLNAGREGLDEASAAADALGLTLSGETIAAAAAAGDSLDLMGSISVGLGNKILTQVAPTIKGLADRFTEFVIQSGAVDVAAQVIAGAFNVIVNAGQIVSGVFQLIGNNVSTVAKAVTLAAQGEFGAAFDALKTGVQNAGKIITGTGQDIVKVWTGELGKVEPKVETTAKTITRLSTATKGTKEETDKGAEAFKRFAESLDEKLRVSAAELASTEKLTDADKLRIKFLGDVESGALKVSAAERDLTLRKIEQYGESLRAKESVDAERKAREDLAKRLLDQEQAEIKVADALRGQIEKQRESNAEIGLTKDELGQLEIRRLADAQATIQQRLETALLNGASDDLVIALRTQVDAYDELIALKKDGLAAAAMAQAAEDAKEAAKDSQEEWKRTSESIQNSLTDALMRGFESGKGFAENAIATVKNLFNSLVLRPIIQAVVQPVAGAVTGALGFAGTANAASGGDALGTLGSAASLFGAGGLWGSLMAGAGWLTGATTFTGALGAAGSLIGTGTLSGAMSGLGMAAGALGPIALGAVALMSLLGDGGGPKTGGTFDTIGLAERLYTPNDADATAQQFGQGVLTSIGEMAKALGGSAGDLKLAFGFDKDPEGDAQSRLSSILRDASGNTLFESLARQVGRDESQFQGEIGTEAARLLLEGLQASDLPQQVAEYLAGYDAAGLGAADIGRILDAAKELAPQAEQSLLDRALEDPGTYTAVSTEVRELVQVAADAYQVHRDSLDVQRGILDVAKQQLERQDAQIRQLGDGLTQVRDRLVELATTAAETLTVQRAGATAPRMVA